LISCSETDDYELVRTELDIRLEESLEQNANGQGKSFFILPDSDDFNAIPQDPLNPLNSYKVALGRLLLHETAAGGDPKMSQMEETYSCATCHPVASSFYSGRRQGVGEGGTGFGSVGEGREIDLSMPIDSVDLQPVRPPTLLHVAYQKTALWNGSLGATGPNIGTESRWAITEVFENNLGFQGVETQGLLGQSTHRLKIDEEFINNKGYRWLFNKAFADINESDRYTALNAALAIAAFNRTLLANRSPWQDYLKGNYEALSEREKKGAIVFTDKGQCISCHTGPALKDQEFHAFGFGHFDDSHDAVVLDDAKFEMIKKGRGGFTGDVSDDYKFKTPTLYNLRDARFYGHGSTFNSIEEVVRYKNNSSLQDQNAFSNLASEMGAIDLTEEEISDLVFFLENSLYDAELHRYAPDAVKSGNCFPNADVQSKIDLGCD
jgi:cytochrome c peroxidase